jgi:hypothetical protein
MPSIRRTGGGSRRNDGAVKTGLGNDIDLDGGVAARVVDHAALDLADRHLDGRSALYLWCRISPLSVVLQDVESRDDRKKKTKANVFTKLRVRQRKK